MKKLLLLTSIICLTACSNPEDKATGDADSSSFNQSGNDKNFNTTDALGSQSHANNNDTSASPSVSSQNSDSLKAGTNRSYKSGDSTHKK